MVGKSSVEFRTDCVILSNVFFPCQISNRLYVRWFDADGGRVAGEGCQVLL